MMKLVPLLFFLAFLVPSVVAQSILVDRNALNTLLGSNRTDEDFESIGLSDGTGDGGAGELSSTNSWGPYNPGPIVSGLTIRSISASNSYLQWNGNNISGPTTRTIQGGDNVLVDFWNPTTAFGIDLKD